MNVEKRIQRLERQNDRLKLALIGMGITVVITFLFVLRSSVEQQSETAIKINARPQVITEGEGIQFDGPYIAEEESEIVRTKKVEFIGDDGEVIAALGSNEVGDGLVMTYNNKGLRLAQLHAIFNDEGLVAVYNIEGQRLVMVEVFKGRHDGISLTNGKSLALVAGNLSP
jgi:hypothetical protein